MEQSHSAQHIQILPSIGTNKKGFQLRSDDMYSETNIYILEQAKRVSRELNTFPLESATAWQHEHSPSKKNMWIWNLYTMEPSTLTLPIFN